MRAERAWFLFRGERSPNGREIPRWGIDRVTNPLPLSLTSQVNSITELKTLTRIRKYLTELPLKCKFMCIVILYNLISYTD